MPVKKKEENNIQEQNMQKHENALSLEEAFLELDKIINGLEENDVTLEKSFQLYHRGMDVLKQCNASIDKIEKELIILEESGI